MFHSDGRWKEFGLNGGEASPFPFWMFCLSWAVVSFLLGRALVPDQEISWFRAASTAAAVTSVPHTLTTRFANTLTEEEEEEIETPPPRRKKRAAPAPSRSAPPAPAPLPPLEEESAPAARPGYYRLNKNATRRDGVPRYVYIGPELPAGSSEEED